MNHSTPPNFPTTRPRRLRSHPLLRNLVRETSLTVEDLILPLFVRPGRGIKKEIKTLSERIKEMSGVAVEAADGKSVAIALAGIPKDEALRLIKDLESQMRAAAKQLEFEKAAQLRDQIIEIRRSMIE